MDPLPGQHVNSLENLVRRQIVVGCKQFQAQVSLARYEELEVPTPNTYSDDAISVKHGTAGDPPFHFAEEALNK